jgi:hypothetical protein
MPQLVGREVKLYTLAQLAAGTAAAGNYNPLNYYTLTPRRRDDLVDDPLIGLAAENVMDAQAPTEDLVEGGFNLDLPLCFNQLGWVLPHLLRVEDPAGDDPYTHVFKSGAREHAGGSFAWQEAGDWRLADTVTWSSLRIGLTPERGRRQISLQGMAGDIAKPATSPIGTPGTALALNPFPAAKGCKIMADDVIMANIMGGDITLSRTLVPFRGAWSPNRVAQEFTPDVNTSILSNLQFRVVNNVWYDVARAKTPQDIKLVFETDAGNSLTIALPASRFVPTERAVGGEGLRTESYQVRSEVTETSAAATLTLINGIAAYPGETE